MKNRILDRKEKMKFKQDFINLIKSKRRNIKKLNNNS